MPAHTRVFVSPPPATRALLEGPGSRFPPSPVLVSGWRGVPEGGPELRRRVVALDHVRGPPRGRWWGLLRPGSGPHRASQGGAYLGGFGGIWGGVEVERRRQTPAGLFGKTSSMVSAGNAGFLWQDTQVGEWFVFFW